MLEVEESSVKLHFARHFTTQAKSQVTYKTLYLEDFKCDLSSSLPYYIYPHYQQNCKKTIQRKTLERFLQHPPFRERATHP